MLHRISFTVLMTLLAAVVTSASPPSRSLFPAEGEDGLPYRRWRIPCLLVAPDDSLLAICEGRVDGGGATGNIDLILKRSIDNGNSWGPTEVIVDMGEDTALNFCPVIDKTTGVIWIVFARNEGSDNEREIIEGKGTPARIFMTHSGDSGRTWTEPVDLTEQLTRAHWTWGGGAPGVGIQLKSGRLLIPAYHAILSPDGEMDYQSHMVYSDDHGKTWKLGETVAPHTNECLVAERCDGTIYYNSRGLNLDRSRPFPAQFRGWKTIAESTDGGVSWGKVREERALVDKPTQGSLHVVPGRRDDRPIWVFTHPSGPGNRNLVARVSFDEGRTWPGFRRITIGDTSYSSVTTMPNGRLGCLFDIWDNERRTNVLRFTEFPVDWLLRDPVAAKLPKMRLTGVRKVEGAGEDHNAFTDLIQFRGRIFLAFRKSAGGHSVHPDSEIIIKTSDDQGKTWTQTHRFSVPGRDVRDPHFLVFKDQLFVFTGTWDARPLIKNRFEMNDHIGVAIASQDGETWTEPRMLEGTHGHYIWRAVARGDTAYLCARRVRNFVRTSSRAQRAHLTEQALLVSEDGWNWKYQGLVQAEYGNETAYLIEEDGSLLGIARNGGGPAQIVRSKPPFTKFDLMNLDRPLGGPLLKKWNQHYLVGGRNTLYGRRECGLYWFADDRLFPALTLPSGGDCSYPGFVQLDQHRALVSWYSSHERYPSRPDREPPSSVFVADIELAE